MDNLVPVANISKQDFVLGSPAGLLVRHPVGGAVVQGRVLAMARLCVEIYKERKRLERETKPRAQEEYGRHMVVLVPVEVIPVGSDGTWLVNLRVSHLNSATHPGIVRTTFIFNENVTDLTKPSRSLKFDWIVGVRADKYVIIGNRELLGNLNEQEVHEKFKQEGYSQIGVISIAEEDRRVGFLVS